MDVFQHIEQLAARRGIRGLQLLEVAGALKSLRKHLGKVTVHPGKAEFARKISVPGDQDTWVVTGEWEDGTVDIVREGGMFPKDALVGYKPGESHDEYWDAIRSGRGDVHEGGDEGPAPDVGVGRCLPPGRVVRWGPRE